MHLPFAPRGSTRRPASARAGASVGRKAAAKRRAGGSKDAPPAEGWVDAVLRRRGAAARLLLAAVACGAIVAATRGWEPALTYRLGDWGGDGVAARVPFAVEDEVQTAGRRAAAAAEVPPAFRNDPAKLNGLAAKFRQQLETVALAEAWEQVPVPVRAAFGLAPEPPGANGRPDPETARQTAIGRFNAIRSALLGRPTESGDDRPGAPERLDAVAAEMAGVLTALGEVGTLTPAALQQVGRAPNQPIFLLEDLPIDDEASPDGPSGTEVTAQARLVEPVLTETARLDVAWNAAKTLSGMRSAAEAWLIANVPATLAHDPAATAAARRAAAAAAEPAVTRFAAGQTLVPPGREIGADELELLLEEHAARVAAAGPAARLTRAAVVAGVLGVLAGLIGMFLRRKHPEVVTDPGRLAAYLGLTVTAVALAWWLSFDPWRAEAVPVLVCAMTLAVAYDPWLAALTGGAVSAVVVFATTAELGHLLVLGGASAAAVLPLTRVPSRSTVITVGFFAAATALAISLALGLIERQPLATPPRLGRHPDHPRRRPAERGVVPVRRVPRRRQPAVHRTQLRGRHGHFAARNERRLPPLITGTGAEGPRHL